LILHIYWRFHLYSDGVRCFGSERRSILAPHKTCARYPGGDASWQPNTFQWLMLNQPGRVNSFGADPTPTCEPRQSARVRLGAAMIIENSRHKCQPLCTRPSYGLTAATAPGWARMRQILSRIGDDKPRAPPSTVPFAAGPRVRIPLAPPASLVRTRFFTNLWRSSHAAAVGAFT